MSRRHATGLLVAIIVGAALTGAALGGFLTNSVVQSETVSYNSSSGANITLEAPNDVDINGTDVFPNQQTVELRTSKGNASFHATAPINATIAAGQLDGSWTNLTNLDVGASNLTVGAENMSRFSVGGDADNVSVRASMALDDGTVDFAYGGASGTTTVIVRGGLPADTDVQAVNESGDVVALGSVNATGALALTGLPNSQHTIKLQQSQPAAPVVSNLDPQGDQSGGVSQFSVDVNDSEFPAGDSVDVKIYLEGNLESTQTISSNQTVTASIPSSGQTGGQHNWSAFAEDNNGLKATGNATYTLPDSLFVRPVNNASSTLTGVDVKITFFGSDEIVTKNTGSSGSVDLTGLPIGEKLLVEADPPNATSYLQRSMILDGVGQEESMYLINASQNQTHGVRFELKDGGQAGQYPASSSDLVIEKPINRSGSINWDRVDGGQFATAGVTTDLIDDDRYRLTVRNDQGDSRTLGTYESNLNETVVLEIDQIEFSPDGAASYGWNASYLNQSGQRSVRFHYSDPERETTELSLRIYERGNESNQVFKKTFSSGPYGNLTVTQQVPKTTDAWVVQWNATRDGELIEGQQLVGPGVDVGPPIDPFWQSVIGVAGLVIMAGLFGGIRAELGAIVVSLLAGILWFVGWLPGAVGAGVILLALGISILYAVDQSEVGI